MMRGSPLGNSRARLSTKEKLFDQTRELRGSKASCCVYLTNGVGYLFSALIFQYPEFKSTPHPIARLKAVLDSALREGKLAKDPRHEKQWLGQSASSSDTFDERNRAFFLHELGQTTCQSQMQWKRQDDLLCLVLSSPDLTSKERGSRFAADCTSLWNTEICSIKSQTTFPRSYKYGDSGFHYLGKICFRK